MKTLLKNILVISLTALLFACGKANNSPRPTEPQPVSPAPRTPDTSSPLDKLLGRYRVTEKDGDTAINAMVTIVSNADTIGFTMESNSTTHETLKKVLTPTKSTSFKTDGNLITQKFEKSAEEHTTVEYLVEGAKITIGVTECTPGSCALTNLTAEK